MLVKFVSATVALFFTISVAANAQSGSDYSEGAPVSFTAAFIGPETQPNSLWIESYVVGYTIENISEQTLEALDVVVVGRNDAGQIVEHVRVTTFAPDSLPSGLVPGDQMVEHHLLPIENPLETVTSISVSVADYRFSE